MRKEIKKTAVLFLVFLLTGIALDIFITRQHNLPRRTIASVNDILRTRIDLLHEYTDQLKGTEDFRERLSVAGPDLFFSEGLAFIITSDDTIVYWSTHHIPDTGKALHLSDTTGMVHLSNGYYYYDRHEWNGMTIHGLIRIKNDYPYNNEYLGKAFQQDLGLPEKAEISLEEGSYNVYSAYGQFLFSISFPEEPSLTDSGLLPLLVIYSITLMLLIALIYLVYEAVLPVKKRDYLLPLLFLIDLVILRWLLFYFEWPAALYDSTVFGPYYFASSGFNRSLGDAFLNNIFLLTAAFLLYFRYRFVHLPKKKLHRYLLAFFAMLLIYSAFFTLIGFYENFIRNSSISLSIDKLFNFSLAGMLGLLTLTFATSAFFFFTARLSNMAYYLLRTSGKYALMVIVTLVILIPPTLLLQSFDPITFVFLAFFLLAYLVVLQRKKEGIPLTSVLMILIFFSFLATYEFNKVNNQKEKNYRKLIAEELTLERDPRVEYEFRKIRKSLSSDSLLIELLTAETPDEERIADYIDDRFSGRSWNDYEIQVTVCHEDALLEIQPEGYIVNCHSYFGSLIETLGVPALTEDLYFLRDNAENSNYIAVLEPVTGTMGQYRIFIELYSFIHPEEGPGYPELLIDRSVNIKSDLTNYSYARYRDGRLTYKYGAYSYRIDLSSYGDTLSPEAFYSWNDFSHYIHSGTGSDLLIISRPEGTWLDRIAPFSYLFILFGLIALLISVTAFLLKGKKTSDLLFKDRFQITVLSIVVLTFVIIGVVTEKYVVALHEKKNTDVLNEKTLSVLTEIEHKLADIDEWTPGLRSYLSDLLTKFSMVFFSDINLYDTEGELISSSRPQIFDEGLISHRMDPRAYLHLHYDQKLQLIQTERIGRQEYLSSYIPFRNNDDVIMGYLNLPYFARQKELRNELMDFLVAYVNIYVLMIVLAIIITIVISRYMTQPLQLIKEKIAQTKLGRLNEKIDWKSKDEIGSLVTEYNRMLDELATSAELLARSERESAWREMAQQIAHEIKNPLTPMKLSVQHLKKAWDDRQPDWEERFEKFTRMIVEQIEALSAIASEFSDFATMPKSKTESVDLRKSIQHAVNLYDESGNIVFSLDLPEEAMWVPGDKEQFIRVFNNLIKNSIQAIGNQPHGRIEIRGSKEEDLWKVVVTDNGAGIPKEMSDKIFSPNFTTKSSGMGLGLAVVQSIIRESGGLIRFESVTGEGTSFFIYLPEARQAM